MKKLLPLITCIALACGTLNAKVQVRRDAKGWRLFDGAKEVEVKGITWSNTPVGENYSYSLWKQDDATVRKVIDYDMPLLKAMGVTAIRSFDDIPPEWVEYIYENYGIYTIINNLLGRYGVTVNGEWKFPTDYSDAATRQALVKMAADTARKYRSTKGILMYMLGNESNYGLEWSGTEIENLPVGDRHRAKAVYLYSVLDEAMAACKDVDPEHPVGIVNGDAQYIDLIAQYCTHMDIFGSNVYRGWKFYDNFYEDVRNTLDKPIVVTECGADAYNALTRQEDQWAQMQYIKSQQQEVYEQAYGKGRNQNILGVFLFEWMDEWWKVYQYKDLDVHNDRATWANSGYSLDYAEGQNNMDEEWFGLCAQSKIKVNGVNKRLPRASYYMMQEVWKMSLYNATSEEIAHTFAALNEPLFLARGNSNTGNDGTDSLSLARIDSLTVTGEYVSPLYVNQLRDNLSDNKDWKTAFKYQNTKGETVEPHFRAETMMGIAFSSAENLDAHMTLTARTDEPYTNLGDVPEMYYRTDTPLTGTNAGTEEKRFAYADLYSASFAYDNNSFDLQGFYHSGHGSYETTGDLFAISREAYDLSDADTDGSKSPAGLQLDAKGALKGFSVMAGPELYNDARPQFVSNYWREIDTPLAFMPSLSVGAVYAEEFGSPENENFHPFDSFGAGRKASLAAQAVLGGAAVVKLGILHAGSERINAEYTPEGGDETKKISVIDSLGGYVYAETGVIPYTTLFADATWRGLVADTNPAPIHGGGFITDSGAGNRMEAKAGATVGMGEFAFQPMVRYRTPLQKAYDRSMLMGSPFIVSDGNREQLDLELVVTYDPEGGTYFYSWDNDEAEQAWLAASVSALYTVFAGETDLIPFKSNDVADSTNADGTVEKNAELWYDSALPEQKNLWQIGGRVVWNPLHNLRVVGTFNAGTVGAYTGGANGTDHETVTFVNAGLAARYNNLIGKMGIQLNDFGPESWWHNANNTFPLQFALDVAYGFSKPSFLDNSNRVGLKVVGRTFGDTSADPYGALPSSAYKNNDTAAGFKDGVMYMEITGYCSLRLK